MRLLRTALTAAIVLLPLASPRAHAAPDASPLVLIEHVVPGLCEQPPCHVRLSLLYCGQDLQLAARSAPPLQLASLSMDRRPPARLLGRFATLAGTFMGRSDTTSLGAFRLRFKVILE